MEETLTQGSELTKKERRMLAKEEKRDKSNRQQQTSKLKKLFFWLIAIGVLIWIGNRVYQFITTPVSEVTVTPIEIYENDWIKGDPDAKVTLIKYEDFQCPACASYFPIVTRLLEDTPQGLRIVFRHFPLVQIHKNALFASKAAEAAGRQEKFWDMHDLLFQNQNNWSDAANPKDTFLEYARQLELDEIKFTEDLDSSEITDKINADITSGFTLKVNATPTFYLNGKMIQPRSYEQFKDLVDTEIKGYILE